MSAAAIKLRTECDELCRQLVRRRVKCERCRTQRGTDTAHLMPRGYGRTRCDLTNLALLCRSCHQDIDTDPEMKFALAVDLLGEEMWESVQRLAEDDPAPLGEQYWMECRNRLRERL